MDHEISRLIMALLLTGLVFFAWNYYQAAFDKKPSESVKVHQKQEEVRIKDDDAHKDLSIYKNCGRLKIVVYPLYKALEYIKSKIKNPGIALILITLVIRLFLTPLTIKQMNSSRRMSGLKDEIEKIKSRYKDNPLEMQKTMGKFLKEKGINPFGSIGMAAIQIPIFFALYKIVREADLFSGAPLGLWVKDLGIADPYYILPFLAGITMFLGGMFTGSVDHQTPKWLMYFFTVIFTIFLLNQPAGLALYMLVGNLFQLCFNEIYKRAVVKIEKL